MNYFEAIKRIAIPSDAQCKNFAEDLCGFHSWYKHLNLYKGNKFVLFLNPTLQSGFDEGNPRMHEGWKTTSEYKAKYGCLDFKWYDNAEDFKQRKQAVIDDTSLVLPEIFFRQSSLTLYPFVSTDFNALESIGYHIHEEDLKKISLAKDYPHRALVLQWADLHHRTETVWQQLTQQEREVILTIMQDEKIPERLSKSASNYLRLEEALNQVYDTLQQGELEKIEVKVAQLVNLVSNQ
ncbi:MAG: hypothetical protein ACFB0B_06645 [Thermonemataceae bacterium]